jgi:uncharacterized protein
MPDTAVDPAAEAAAARLCLDCGLCCNGVLFDNVRLQPGDTAKALTAQGLKIKKGQFFKQPCSGLNGALCTLYQNRPTRCRAFVCGQFKAVAARDVDFATAAGRIAEVRHGVAEVERLLSGTAGYNLRKPLAQRFATAMGAELEEGQRVELDAAMSTLQEKLTTWFRC